MAFSSAISHKTVFGNKRVNFGTFTNGASDTGGDINTGLRSCEAMFLQAGGNTADKAAALNETLPVAGSAVTIVTAAGVDGSWMAVGY
jgi:hypothetical protein